MRKKLQTKRAYSTELIVGSWNCLLMIAYILDLSVLVCYIYCLSCRYQLYGQWKSQSYYTQPELISARLSTLKKAKYIFSRLTKDNVKQQGRMIGKLSHANPTVFFEYVSTRISFSSTQSNTVIVNV